jgi:hypothetical protein
LHSDTVAGTYSNATSRRNTDSSSEWDPNPDTR